LTINAGGFCVVPASVVAQVSALADSSLLLAQPH
jgi:hypothetical protein